MISKNKKQRVNKKAKKKVKKKTKQEKIHRDAGARTLVQKVEGGQ